MRRNPALLPACFVAAWLLPAAAVADDTDTARFFADCPAAPAETVQAPLTTGQRMAYSLIGLGQVEVVRAADWSVDLLWPGRERRPFYSLVALTRSGYAKLPRNRLHTRMGEVADALQLPELSFGDVASTVSPAGPGPVGVGTGTLDRGHRLIDAAQHLVGDVNWLVGAPVGRRQGLITLRWPGQVIDGLQSGLTLSLNLLSGLAGQVLDTVILTTEGVVKAPWTMWRRPACQERTVFVQLPRELYAQHQRFWHRHRRGVFVGTAEELRTLTHAELFHPRRGRRYGGRTRAELDRVPSSEATVVVVTDDRLARRLHDALRPYVVPAEWVLEPD